MIVRFVVCCAAATWPLVAAAQRALPTSKLALRTAAGSVEFWRSDAAPVTWTTAPLAARIVWKAVAEGVETGDVTLGGTGEAWRTRLVVVRLDPKKLVFSLDTAMTKDARPAWNVARTPRDAVFAVNAGQFRTTFPWGQVILNGHRILPPERGPLAMLFAVDSSGSVHWRNDGEPNPPATMWAFQSYPVLLRANAVPFPLQGAERGVDVGHRDARLALGRLPDGSLIVAVTRFAGLGNALGSVPLGLTVPEMAAVMGALGANDAVLLDGGISAQLVAGQATTRTTLEGWRDVPLGLIARPRTVR